MLQIQHKTFLKAYKNTIKEKARAKKYNDKTAVPVDLTVGDNVYYKKHKREGKHDLKWVPNFQILEHTSPTSYIIKNIATGLTKRAHFNQLRLQRTDWPSRRPPQHHKTTRKCKWVESPESSDNIETDESDEVMRNERAETPKPAVDRLVEKARMQRSDSDSEDHIPRLTPATLEQPILASR